MAQESTLPFAHAQGAGPGPALAEGDLEDCSEHLLDVALALLQ